MDRMHGYFEECQDACAKSYQESCGGIGWDAGKFGREGAGYTRAGELLYAIFVTIEAYFVWGMWKDVSSDEEYARETRREYGSRQSWKG